MFIFQAVILGIVQGLTEFLPVSSSAHLLFVPKLFNWPEHTLFFDTALHLGTALAVILYFLRDWINILKNGKDLTKIIIGIIPAGLAGFLFSSYIEMNVRSLLVVSFTLIAGTLIMLFAEKYVRGKGSLKEKVSLTDSIFIGLMQVLALVPGMSRSGMTISGGFFRRIKKEEVVKFSFYLSAPIIFAAAAFSFIKSYKAAGNFDFLDGSFAIGFVMSFLTGLFAIKFMLAYIDKKGFGVFIWYRLFLALLVLLFYLI